MIMVLKSCFIRSPLQPKCTLDRFEKNSFILFVLSSVLAAFGQSATTTSGLAQNGTAGTAKNDGLSVAKSKPIRSEI